MLSSLLSKFRTETPSEPAPNAAGLPPCKADKLNVALLIDITGSMSAQIEAVKLMSRTFAASLGASALNLQLHVLTFTESSKGCYTSHFTATDPHQLVKYIERLTLCRPPEAPNVSDASGGDGPENTMAGLVTLVERVGTDRDTLCFIISDAPPHFENACSREVCPFLAS